jgi:hypothetical protein
MVRNLALTRSLTVQSPIFHQPLHQVKFKTLSEK